MSKLQTRVKRLEKKVLPAEDERPAIMIYYEGETREETLARYGLPPDFEGGIWLPEVKRITIGGIDLREDI